MMKRIISITLALFLCATISFAQKAKGPAKGKTKTTQKTTKAKVKTQDPLVMPLMIKGDDGSSSFFDLKRGDKLVYHVNANGKEYDFIVTINDESYEKGVDFNYEMTDPVNLKGHVLISAKGKNESNKYVNYFRGGEMQLDDACTVWMTGLNFSDMPNKQTTMIIDNNEPETFYRPDNDEVYPVVNVKGKMMKIDGFRINNAKDGSGNKTLWINGISSNSLILKMDLGWTIELKEIR